MYNNNFRIDDNRGADRGVPACGCNDCGRTMNETPRVRATRIDCSDECSPCFTPRVMGIDCDRCRREMMRPRFTRIDCSAPCNPCNNPRIIGEECCERCRCRECRCDRDRDRERDRECRETRREERGEERCENRCDRERDRDRECRETRREERREERCENRCDRERDRECRETRREERREERCENRCDRDRDRERDRDCLTGMVRADMQHRMGRMNGPCRAMQEGTLYTDLNKPMCGDCCRNRDSFSSCQKANFTQWELRLYLDTHPHDREAQAMLHRMMEEDKRNGYANAFLPRRDDCNRWSWLDEPWPWEYRSCRDEEA